MRKRRYKFTDKNQSRQGIISSIMGAIALLLTIGLIAAAYMQNGQVGKWIAILGILIWILAGTGMYHGIRGTKEEDTYRLFPWLGCGMNGIVLAAFVLIYILGW